jgi:hypothetical protein
MPGAKPQSVWAARPIRHSDVTLWGTTVLQGSRSGPHGRLVTLAQPVGPRSDPMELANRPGIALVTT